LIFSEGRDIILFCCFLIKKISYKGKEDIWKPGCQNRIKLCLHREYRREPRNQDINYTYYHTDGKMKATASPDFTRRNGSPYNCKNQHRNRNRISVLLFQYE